MLKYSLLHLCYLHRIFFIEKETKEFRVHTKPVREVISAVKINIAAS